MHELVIAAEELVRFYEAIGDHDHGGYSTPWSPKHPNSYGDCPVCHMKAVIHVKKAEMKPQWEKLVSVKNGHKLFLDKVSGRLGLADQSGNLPEDTDDGIIWVDTNLIKERGLVKLTDFLEGYGYSVNIPCLREDGKDCVCHVHLRIAQVIINRLRKETTNTLTITLIDPHAGIFSLVKCNA